MTIMPDIAHSLICNPLSRLPSRVCIDPGRLTLRISSKLSGRGWVRLRRSYGAQPKSHHAASPLQPEQGAGPVFAAATPLRQTMRIGPPRGNASLQPPTALQSTRRTHGVCWHLCAPVYLVMTVCDCVRTRRIAAFRCLLNRRGVRAAPLMNAVAREAPPGPGGCLEQ